MRIKNFFTKKAVAIANPIKRGRINFLSDTKGVAATEFALIAPVLVILALGVIDVGNAISENFDLKAAARTGAEYAVANRADTEGIRQAVINANNNSSATLAVSSNVFCECSFQAAITCGEPCPGEDITPRQFVTVTVTDSYNPLFLPEPGEDENTFAIIKTVTALEASVTLRIE